MTNNTVKNLSRAEKITLMILGIDSEPIKGKVWFQKELFLVSKLDEKLSDQLNFKPHHYGPHSYEAQYVLENLEAEGFIETFNDEILITDEGDEVYHDLKKEFSKDQIEFYKYVKDFY